LEESLNCDDVFSIATTDYNIFSFLTATFFVNNHFFLDTPVKTSFLDVLLLTETSKTGSSRKLFDFLL